MGATRAQAAVLHTLAPNTSKLLFARVIHEFVELRAGIFGAGLAQINPPANNFQLTYRTVRAEIPQLKLTTLVFGDDLGVNADSHTTPYGRTVGVGS